MVHLGITSGPWQLVYQKEHTPHKGGTVLAATLAIPITTMYLHLHLLEITTTVNQEIQQMLTFFITCTPLTLSGMAISVKASVAAMENLLHGSVWTYQTQQLMILRSAFVWVKEVSMMLSSSYLNSTCKIKTGYTSPERNST